MAARHGRPHDLWSQLTSPAGILWKISERLNKKRRSGYTRPATAMVRQIVNKLQHFISYTIPQTLMIKESYLYLFLVMIMSVSLVKYSCTFSYLTIQVSGCGGAGAGRAWRIIKTFLMSPLIYCFILSSSGLVSARIINSDGPR